MRFVLLLVVMGGGVVMARPQEDSVAAVLTKCLRDKHLFLPCLQQRAVDAWDQALSSDEPMKLLDGLVSIEKTNATSNSTALLDSTSMEELPSDPGARSFKLNDMLWSRISKFMDTRTIKLSLPLSAEGRGKLKKFAEPLAMAVMWKAMMVSLAMGALALLAGKALIVSKLALTLSMLLALRRLMGGANGGNGFDKIDIYAKHYGGDKKLDGGGAASYLQQSVSEPDGGYYGHKRSFQPLPPGVVAASAFLGSAPALDVNNNVYEDNDFAQIKAAAGANGRRRGVDLGAVIRKNANAHVQKLDKEKDTLPPI